MTDPIVDSPCPSCGLPLSERALAAETCPCCGAAFLGCEQPGPEPQTLAQPVPVTVEPTAPHAPQYSRQAIRATAWVGAALLVIGVGVASYLLALPDEAPRVAETKPPDPETPAAQTPAPAPTPSQSQPRAELAPSPREVSVVRPLSPVTAVAVAPEPRPKADAPRVLLDPFDGPERKLDLPNGTAEVADLNGEDKLTLTGKVKVLKIGPVNGSAVIDASALEVDEIELTGDINGGTVVKLNSAGGRITIAGHVNGSAKLTIHAPGGEVVFAGGDDTQVTGGTVVTITAKRLDFRSQLSGGTRIDATLTKGGSLRTRVMDGGATLRYKAASHNDPELKVETGESRGGASVKPAM